MSKNNNITQLDTDQIIKKKFDEELDAERVVLVGSQELELSVDSDKIAKAVKEGLSEMVLEIPKYDNQMQIIEKNVFIPQIEIKYIEKPVIIKEIEYKEIEKPIIIEKVVTIEKPIILKEIEFKEITRERHYPLIMKIAALIQAVCVIGLLLINIIKR